PRVARAAAVPWSELPHPAPFGGARQELARAAGAVELGASRMRVPPGEAAFPRHAHLGDEEAVLILGCDRAGEVGDPGARGPGRRDVVVGGRGAVLDGRAPTLGGRSLWLDGRGAGVRRRGKRLDG